MDRLAGLHDDGKTLGGRAMHQEADAIDCGIRIVIGLAAIAAGLLHGLPTVWPELLLAGSRSRETVTKFGPTRRKYIWSRFA
jgi:hypothetical protein